ncbi:hypothetical protein KAFR_0B02040 [Kazachstania africana CBS 2517]|uniref:Mitochondrial aspartate-glutamate transporter AGC1 n=1 Tax=Kazachstania africana (strain ATCC 22294 / BCRC 22015 / CBS 2517 / CECT 1963 / NBRC 1671 / NRRL Y-8276) TaxID=1071382 RepID=H2AQ52_KAZAF|nr:hypothetical protein KAFR_0B02040 [Kazachstania africana CBS 2517]CCF56502.1 hypothetical protein KAFR_0B02040 [Kazachstania africana CBS 2517]
MEQINSNSDKKIQQTDIFRKFATPKQDGYEASGNGELVLTYNDFIKLISTSKKLFSEFTDHSFNLNQVPDDTFGCIFFTIDENNKGYLTINDWFYFNNILEHDNFHVILLYEFFRKFDIERIKARNVGRSVADKRTKSINYNDKSLSFDNLYLNLKQFKKTVEILQDCVNDDFIKRNNIFLDWNQFSFLKFYITYPYGNNSSVSAEANDNNSYLTLNSLLTILQNDLKNERLFMGFDRLSHYNPLKNALTLSKNQLIYLLELFYSHRVPANVFRSLNLSNASHMTVDNNAITFNIFKDIFYLFQNFDLLNQILIRYVTKNDLTENDLKGHVITKKEFLKLLNAQYNKVNNITEFSPSQINLLFSIVANSKRAISVVHNSHHEVLAIDNFIHNEFKNGNRTDDKKEDLKKFNVNYDDITNEFLQDTNQLKKVVNSDQRGIISNSEDALETTIDDFLKILNPNYLNDLVHQLEIEKFQSQSLYINYYFYPIFDSMYNFALGSVAGCIGSTFVYPIDFIKTRMQAQRSLTKYKNSIDCLIKVYSREGIKGLFSGLGFQLLGVAPEKAIKLTINDFLRNKLTDKRNASIKLPNEVFAGAIAGACQVLVTNPIEIVKIKLQVRSEYLAEADSIYGKANGLHIIKKLGFPGLYRGITACLMRDVPFSAIYFPTYAHLKKDIFHFDPNKPGKRKRLKTWELLTAGALAGMPAAFLTTPLDVIKTRLQIEPKHGETRYTGIFHAFKTILREENFRSFFKGGGARVLRSSPQFGFTLAAYELFKNIFPLDFDKPEVGATSSESTIRDEIPSVASSFARFRDSMNSSLHNRNGLIRSHTNGDDHEFIYNDFYSPLVDPYSATYLNYYYKSCQISKTFIDLDNNFSQFDHSTYLKFYSYLKSIEKMSN